MNRRWLLVLGTVVLLAACSSGGTSPNAATGKLGATPQIVLTLANPNTGTAETPPIEVFQKEVEKRTDGRVTVRVSEVSGAATQGSEQTVADAVRSGAADFGYANSTVIAPLLPAPALEALTAPMLMGDDDLLRAVVSGDIGGEVLGSVTPSGVTGLALWADIIRYPIGSTHALTAPRDFAGKTYWARVSSRIEQATFRALGAKPGLAQPSDLGALLAAGTYDGLVFDPYWMTSNGWQARYFTYNEGMWPRLNVLIANPARLAGLSEADRKAVLGAAAASTASSLDFSSSTEALSTYCSSLQPVVPVVASSADLAQMRKAVEPVYQLLRKDAAAASVIDKIEALKATMTPAPMGSPAGCATAGPTPSSSAPASGGSTDQLDGTYRQVVTDGMLKALGYSETETSAGTSCEVKGVAYNCLVENHGTFTWTLAAGKWSFVQRAPEVVHFPTASGTFTISDQMITWTDDSDPARTTVNTWARSSDGTITLGVVPGQSSPAARLNAVASWVPVG